MTSVRLDTHVWSEIAEACAACFPREACGVVVVGPDGLRFVPFENQADRLHAHDPVRFPRDARTSYVMDPLALSRLLDGPEQLLAVVHSHPQHPSYFSDTDARAASPFGTPTYPGAAQVVVSVYEGVVRDAKAFRWDGAGWPEIPLEGAPPLPGPPAGAVAQGGTVVMSDV